ncbi:MAG: thiopurine S-methyltransferase, partial [Nitrospinae bacterium]|nr:thiopurine S-methyltransferase [Nitrospinota bacterium]
VETAGRLLRPGALLIGLFYETGEEGGPPFNTTRDNVVNCFSDRFEIQSLDKTPHSIERRQGKEWLGVFKRK